MAKENIKNGLITLCAFLTLIIVTVNIYWNGLNGPFLLDDKNNIYQAKTESLSIENLTDIILDNESGPTKRPLSVLSFVLTEYFHGLNPFKYKFINLMLHLICGILIFWLTGIIVNILREGKTPNSAWIVAGIVASVWLVHPLHISTTLYVVQRMAQLSSVFTLLALISYTIGREKTISNKKWGISLIIAGILLFGPLAIFSKENGALIPLYILLLEIFIFKLKINPQIKIPLIAIFGFFIILPILFGGIYFLLHFDKLLSLYEIREFTLYERVITEIKIIFFYIKMILIPNLSDMGLYHDDFPITKSIDLITYILLFGLFSISVLIYKLRNTAPIISFGLSWFFVSHVIESTILPLELIFEHRNYLASFGLLLIPTYYLIYSDFFLKNLMWVRYALAALIICVFSSLSFIRSSIWSSNESLVLKAVQDHPNSFRAHMELANIYLSKNNIQEARNQLKITEILNLNDAGPIIHRLATYCISSSVPELLFNDVKKDLQFKKYTPYVLNGLDLIRQSIDQTTCPAITQEMLEELFRSLISGKSFPQSGLSTYYAYTLYGRVLLSGNKYEEAMDAYSNAHNAYPGKLDALLEKVNIQIGFGDLVDAKNTISKLYHENKKLLFSRLNHIKNLEFLLVQAQEHKADIN